MCRELPDTVQRAIVQPGGAMRLSLQSDPDMLDWTGEYRVRQTCERTGQVILAV